MPLLRSDLGSLAFPVTAPSVAFDDSGLCDPSWRAGAIYVVEGSALGGKVIAQHLRRHFGRAIESALSYYDLYGKDVGRIWRDIRNELNAARIDTATAVAGARATFTFFSRAMAAAAQTDAADARSGRRSRARGAPRTLADAFS